MRLYNLFSPLVAACLGLLFHGTTLTAAPFDPQIIQGQVSFTSAGLTTIIEASDGSIINYESFNIEKNESVHLIQSDSNARVFVRIESDEPTYIDGSLDANGIVYLVNAAGVVFSLGSSVEDASLYVIAAELGNDDFNHYQDNFSYIKGDVINKGKINSTGFVRFIGRHVLNEGEIIAAEDVSAFITENGSLQIEGLLCQSMGASENEKKNIQGLSDLNSVAILHSGFIQGATVVLQSNYGTAKIKGDIDTSNGKSGHTGGNIHVFGDVINLEGAVLDASGYLGGGLILLGGDYEGKGPHKTATTTSIDQHSTISANALNEGNGGKVIVWSDTITQFDGKIYVLGGEAGGDGGFVETSGKENLGIKVGEVHVDAPKGKAGTWFLDPTNIVIKDEGSLDYKEVDTFPPVSGPQVELDASVINNFSSGVLYIAATNKVTISANLYNSSSTIDLRIWAGNEIRMRKDNIQVPNGKVSLIVANSHSGQIVCQSSFNQIVAHELTVQAPVGGTNGFQIEADRFEFVLSNSKREEPIMAINSDIIAKGPGKQRLFFKGQNNEIGAVLVVGAVKGFNELDNSAGLTIDGPVDLVSVYTSGEGSISLSGGGKISHSIDFNNTGGIFLGGSEKDILIIGSDLNTRSSLLVTRGNIVVNGDVEISSLTLAGNTGFSTRGHDFHTTGNINQATPRADLSIETAEGFIEIAGHVDISNLNLMTTSRTTFSNSLKVNDFIANSDLITLADDFVVNGLISVNNLNTTGIGKTVKILGGGKVSGASTFNNTGGIILGGYQQAELVFAGPLDTSIGMTTVEGRVIVNGRVDIADLYLSGDTTFVTKGNILNIKGFIDKGLTNSDLTISTDVGGVEFNGPINVNNFNLLSTSTATFKVPVTVNDFTTTSPFVAFYEDLVVYGSINTEALITKGEGKTVKLLGGGVINGKSKFTNSGGLKLGASQSDTFQFASDLHSLSGDTIVQGHININGLVELANLGLSGHTSFDSNGHTFKVSGEITQLEKDVNLSIKTSQGEISLAGNIEVQNLTLETSKETDIKTVVKVKDFATSSPSITFYNDLSISGVCLANNFNCKGNGKNVVLLGGGSFEGSALFENSGTLVLGKNDRSTFTFKGQFDRTVGRTLARGTIQTVNKIINMNVLIPQGALTLKTTADNTEGMQINFNSKVDGNNPVIIDAGMANVLFNSKIGGESPISAMDIIASEIEIRSNVSVGEGPLNFKGNLFLANNVSISNLGEGITFYGTIDGAYDLDIICNTSGGAVSFQKAIGKKMALNSVNVLAKQIEIGADMTAQAGALYFDGDVLLTQDATLVDGGATGITFLGPVNGAYNLTLETKGLNGTITFLNEVGNILPLNKLHLLSVNNVIFPDVVRLGQLETNAPLLIFSNDVEILKSIIAVNVLTDGVRKAALFFGTGTFSGHANFANTGALVLGDNDIDHFIFKGNLERTAGPTQARGKIRTINHEINFSKLYISGPLAIQSNEASTEGQNIHFYSHVDGQHSLVVQAGKGKVFFDDQIGSQIALDSLEVSAKEIELKTVMNIQNGLINFDADLLVTNDAIVRNRGSQGVIFNGNINGDFDLEIELSHIDAVVHFNKGVGESIPLNHLGIVTNNELVFPQVLNTGTLTTSTPTLTFAGNTEIRYAIHSKDIIAIGSDNFVSILGGGVIEGNAMFYNTGTITLGDSKKSVLTVLGSIDTTAGNTRAQGILKTVNQTIDMDALTMTGNLKILTTENGTEGKQIHFHSSIDGNGVLEVDSGRDNIIFQGKVGVSQPINALTVTAKQISINSDVNAQLGKVCFNGDLIVTNNLKIIDGITYFHGSVNGNYELEIETNRSDGMIVFDREIGNQTPLDSLILITNKDISFPYSVDVNNLQTTSPNLIFNDNTTITESISALGVATNGSGKYFHLLGGGTITGDTQFANTGGVVFGGNESNILVFSGSLRITDSPVSMMGKIKSHGIIEFSDINLLSNTTLDTSDHNIIVKGNINSKNLGSKLFLQTGPGHINIYGDIEIGHLTLNTSTYLIFTGAVNVNDLITSSPSLAFHNDVVVAGIVDTNDLSVFGEEVSLSLLGGGFVKGEVVFANTGSLTFGKNDSTVLTFHSQLDTTGNKTYTQGIIETVNKTIDMGELNLAGNTTVRSTSGNTPGRNIYFHKSIEGPKQLRAVAGNAKICFDATVGNSVPLESLSATASKIEIDADMTAQGGAMVYAGDVVLTRSANLIDKGSAGIIFQGTVNADSISPLPVDLTVESEGKIDFQKDVGDINALNIVKASKSTQVISRAAMYSKKFYIPEGTVAEISESTELSEPRDLDVWISEDEEISLKNTPKIEEEISENSLVQSAEEKEPVSVRYPEKSVVDSKESAPKEEEVAKAEEVKQEKSEAVLSSVKNDHKMQTAKLLPLRLQDTEDQNGIIFTGLNSYTREVYSNNYLMSPGRGTGMVFKSR